MEERSVPFLQLMVESWNSESLVLALIPVVMLLTLALVVTVIWVRRRRLESAEWKQAEDAANLETPKPLHELDVQSRASKVELEPPTAAIEDTREPSSAPAAAPESMLDEIRKVDQPGWLNRLRSGLSRTRESFGSSLSALFGGGQLSDDLIEQIHGVMYKADLGVATTDHLTDLIRKDAALRSSGNWETAKGLLRQEITAILKAVEPATVDPMAEPPTTSTTTSPTTSMLGAAPLVKGPWVVLVVGVNGAGKTTTIGKLAGFYASQGKKVMLAAGDTFRAAAIEQLQVWGDRAGAEVIKQQQGSDPAAVAYDAIKAAIARKADVLIVDTAGRLQNKEGLMAELAKIRRVMSKDLPDAPHETWLVIDATTGQNAVSQVKAFTQAAPLSGLIVTKLDGTAKGGFIIGIAHQFKLPIRFIGVGEKASDLRPFRAAEFAESVL